MDDDSTFLESFTNTTLPFSEWTHAAHVRMAFLQLTRFPYQVALEHICSGIRRYNAANGRRHGYHDTVTVAYTRLINYRRLLSRCASWQDFAKENGDLLQSQLLTHYYNQDVLDSDAARSQFVAPDRKSLPPGGNLRVAEAKDAAAIAKIYAPYVNDTAITFEIVPPSPAEMERRIREVGVTSWLVFESSEQVIGYAYAAKHRDREAYQWTVEVSLYIDGAWRGCGIGRLLYTELFRRLTELGYYVALAGITLPNTASVAIHEALGFTKIGVYHNVGYKCGAWHAVGWWERPLRSFDGSAPAAPRRVL